MTRRGLRRLTPLEYDEQCVVIAWADRTNVDVGSGVWRPLGRYLYAIPNGEVLNSGLFDKNQRMARIGRLRRAGFRKGALDLCLDLPRGPYHGARLEMKSAGNRPTDDQAQWMVALLEAGYHVGWADSAGDAIAWLRDYVALGRFRQPVIEIHNAGGPGGQAPGMHRPDEAGSTPAPATSP